MMIKRFFSSNKHIINNDMPICRNCKFIIPYISNIQDDKYSLSTCSHFGTRNIVDGTIKYEYAEVCRLSKKKCGLEGKYYEPTIPN